MSGTNHKLDQIQGFLDDLNTENIGQLINVVNHPELTKEKLTPFLDQLELIAKFGSQSNIDEDTETALLHLHTELQDALALYLAQGSTYDEFKKTCDTACKVARPTLQNHTTVLEVLVNIMLAVLLLPVFLANMRENIFLGKPTFFIAKPLQNNYAKSLDATAECINDVPNLG